MDRDSERDAPSRDEDVEDLQFLRDEGLDLLAKLKNIRDVALRRQITKALHVFLDEQINKTRH